MTDTLRPAQTIPLLSSSDLSLQFHILKKRAKEFRDAVRAKDPDALLRLSIHHPRASALTSEALKLADAQCVIAREAGLSSWPALKKHSEDMDRAKQEIENDNAAPDSDLPTLHIRCGNDIEQALERAGFEGDFLTYTDPICQGPLSDQPDAKQQRLRFVLEEYPGLTADECRQRQLDEDTKLSNAKKYGRIVLWFEHDPFDQLLLVKVLNQLRASKAEERKVELVSLDRFPGISKFIGIGQLSPTALRHMYKSRIPVPEAAYGLSRQVWKALVASSPERLFAMTGSQQPSLPYLRTAILRYLSDLPSVHNGLSFSENAALKILAGGDRSWGQVFRKFMTEFDPLPYHGDLMYLGTLLRLQSAERPAVSCAKLDLSDEGWGKSEFSITGIGQELLNNEVDWMDCGPRERHHGGVICFGTPDWRWDAKRQTVMQV